MTLAKRLLRLHTLASYADGLGIAAYTTESPWASPDIERRIEGHLIAVETILERVCAAR